MGRRSRTRRTPPHDAPAPKSTRRPGANWRSGKPRPHLPRRTRLALGLVALALLLIIDDRYPGAIADGRQMTWTAIAIVETGEIGQARSRDFTWPRPEGDGVSRYGMGMSLAQVPAAWLAPGIEDRLGPGSSQPLFLVVPLACVLFAAWAAARASTSLGVSTGAAIAALLLASAASPLGAYASLDLSEPLQAASLAVALAFAVEATHEAATRQQALRRAAMAGVATGMAVLTKSSLFAVVPFVLLPLFASAGTASRQSRAAAALLGFSAPAVTWAWFELTRFGRLFASYGGEGFTHPWLDGAWRLLVGPNRGFVLYNPALVLALLAVVVAWRRGPTRRALAASGAAGAFLALLALAAPWWAWHGLWGWGPRLLVPAVPLLAAAASIVLDRWPGSARIAFVTVSVLINLPGLWQNAAPVTMYGSSCAWPEAPESFARSLAAYARREGPPGTFRVPPDQVLETVPAASPLVVYPWFAGATGTTDVDAAARALQLPPWLDARPDITCTHDSPEDFIRRLLRRPGWPIWGRGFSPDPAAPGFPGVYDEGLLDQVVRAQQLGRGQQALELAQKLVDLAPSSEADAHLLESLRLLGRRTEAAAYLSSLSRERRATPKINVVLALFERDGGNEETARQLLGSIVHELPGTPAEHAINAPLAAWPRDLFSMTTVPTDQAGQ